MRRLILHIPDLEHLPGGASRLPDRLQRLLTRARRRTADPRDYWPELIGCPRLPAPGPLAALGSADSPAEVRGRRWIRFDPVRLIPDLTAVWVQHPLPLDLAGGALRRELDQLLSAEGLAWRPCGGFGVVELAEPTGCEFTAPQRARGARLDEVLPRGDDARRWIRLINESQMMFHRFRSAARGDQHGAGLWFWGEGRATAPAGGAADLAVVANGSTTWRGVARWLGADVRPAQRFEDLSGAPRLLVHAPLDEQDPVGSLAGIDRRWVAPAMRALARGRLGEVVVAGGAGTWRCGRIDGWAFWRRKPTGLVAGEDRG